MRQCDGRPEWIEGDGEDAQPYVTARALLLSLAGVPDAIGVDRIGRILVPFERAAHGRDGKGHGYGFKRSPNRTHGWWLSDHGGPTGISYGSEPAGPESIYEGRVPVITVPELAGVDDTWPEEIAEAWALATILAARIGGSVVTL